MDRPTIHLDTSFLIRALRMGSSEDGQLRAFLRAHRELAICSIAWTEFLCGPLDASQLDAARRLTSERIPFTEQDASLAAELFNRSGRRPSSLTDCMIAAAALRRRAQLATSNPVDFERLGVTLAT
jgi:predicted nucleic acid-binding protein